MCLHNVSVFNLGSEFLLPFLKVKFGVITEVFRKYNKSFSAQPNKRVNPVCLE